ncbi:MAG TPA: HEAT repeat domain-containing protein [Kofleriaceae bacterium]|nr:HEAT repeat domain-containing protein [Kofleriaceae bacterium]
MLQAALHRDAERRQYFFEVATDFQRLVVPGSLTWKPSDAVLEQIFAAALHDASASVRERAIVYAYGLGWVQRLIGELLRLSRDPVEAVRQYALVALGIADDDESLSVLFAALDGDRKQEMQSAIWALARRPQGLSRLLTMAGDTRPWVVDDILGAIKQVSLPLTDEQLDEVRARVVVPRDEIQFERVFKHHRWRTRDPEGKELPPDRIMRYEMKGAM